MKIDKKSNACCYNDNEHVYWNETTNKKYTSVTTLIGKFKQEFDSDFWSSYKAFEKLFPGYPEIAKEIKANLRKVKKFNINLLEENEIDEEIFYKVKQEFLDAWELEKVKSCERGTKIHLDKENEFYVTKTHELAKFGLGGKFECKKDHYELGFEKGVYPEYLVHVESKDGFLMLAGQIDLLIKDGNDIYIVDYKGLPLDTPIATIDGWKLMKNIEIGDIIFDKDGKPTKVLNTSEVHNNPCYKINFDNSESIICDHEHKWVISFYRGKDKWKHVEMRTDEILNFMETHSRTSYNIPKIINAKPLELPNVELPIDPYIFGAWLGDGSKSCGIITNTNKDFWKEVEKRGCKYGENLSDENHAEMRTIYDIRGKLNELGVLNNKCIPEIYLRASYKQRLDLLRGIMDTDGYYHEARERFVMNTSQEWQAKDLVKLITSLGWKPTMFEVINKCDGKEFPGWNVCFWATENPFLIRNQEIKLEKQKDNHSFRTITSIEKVETVETKCIEVDSPTHTYLAGHSLIPTHITNKKIDQKSFYDSAARKSTMMKHPLSNIMDSNFWHYTMQLSTYAWMIEKLNPELKIKGLILIHYDHAGNPPVSYELEYLKEDVEKMLRYFKRKNKVDYETSLLSPITF